MDQFLGSTPKADRLGRTHYSIDNRSQVLEAFERSSLSGSTFAEQCGIKYSTFASRVAKRKRETVTTRQSNTIPDFVVAEVAKCPISDALEVTLAAQIFFCKSGILVLGFG